MMKMSLSKNNTTILIGTILKIIVVIHQTAQSSVKDLSKRSKVSLKILVSEKVIQTLQLESKWKHRNKITQVILNQFYTSPGVFIRE